MALNRKIIEAFFRGKELPAKVVEEIHLALDDPESEVSRLSAEYARITRMMFDPDGPLFGPTETEFNLWEEVCLPAERSPSSRPKGIERHPERGEEVGIQVGPQGQAVSGEAEVLIHQISHYLAMAYTDLLGQLPLFLPAAVHADPLAPYRPLLRRIVCKEWNWGKRRDNPDYQDPARLADALAQAIAGHASVFPFPPALLAAILLKEGLDDFCDLEDTQ